MENINKMPYEQKIEIYRIKTKEIVTPLAQAPEELTAEYNKGDFLIIIGLRVWVTNRKNEEDVYSEAVYKNSGAI